MKKIYLIPLSILLLTGVFWATQPYLALGALSNRLGLAGKSEVQTYTFFTATTTTATSTNVAAPDQGYFKIAGADKVTMYFSRGGLVQPNTGISTFSVEVTPDGTNWYPWNQLIDNTATSSDQWMVASKAIEAATSTSIMGMNLQNMSFYGVRCIVNETTDGEHTCVGQAEFK